MKGTVLNSHDIMQQAPTYIRLLRIPQGQQGIYNNCNISLVYSLEFSAPLALIVSLVVTFRVHKKLPRKVAKPYTLSDRDTIRRYSYSYIYIVTL